MARNFSVWSISDLHLSFGVANKSMDVFGPQWKDHPDKIFHAWMRCIHPEDLVLIAGDISWAIKLEDALPDLAWIEKLPGTKVLIRGNHDYWWKSLSKLQSLPFSSIHYIQNNAFDFQDISIGGSRLWDTWEFHFDDYIDYKDFPMVKPVSEEDKAKQQQVFDKEVHRLKTSLDALSKKAKVRIAMTHYPPIGPNMKESTVSRLLEKYEIDFCVFGHLHNARPNLQFGEKNGVRYFLTSCDYLNFKPIKIL